MRHHESTHVTLSGWWMLALRGLLAILFGLVVLSPRTDAVDWNAG